MEKTSTVFGFVHKCLLVLTLCSAVIGCGKTTKTSSRKNPQISVSSSAVNINEANSAELETLPYVGAKTAKEIIRHREKFGKFRRGEHLMLVRGISDKRFRRLRTMIRIK